MKILLVYAIYGFHFRKVAEKIRGSGMLGGDGEWDERNGYV